MPRHSIVLERLRLYSEEEICDLLEITSEDLIDRFMDKIELKYDYLESELELFDEEEYYEEINNNLSGFQIEQEDDVS